MLVVSDTFALPNLTRIGRLDLLRNQFSEILMPTAVARELSSLRDAAAQQALARASDDGWLIETPLPANSPFPPELHGLDPGETEALRLALAISANRVLLDEKDGRQRAAALGIRTTGVLGVLVVAKQSGSIASLKDEMTRLRNEAGFFISSKLEALVLATVGE